MSVSSVSVYFYFYLYFGFSIFDFPMVRCENARGEMAVEDAKISGLLRSAGSWERERESKICCQSELSRSEAV